MLQGSPLPVAGENYRHYKTGEVYKVLGVASHTERPEYLVVYQHEGGDVYARPLDIFLELVYQSTQGLTYRFTKV